MTRILYKKELTPIKRVRISAFLLSRGIVVRNNPFLIEDTDLTEDKIREIQKTVEVLDAYISWEQDMGITRQEV